MAERIRSGSIGPKPRHHGRQQDAKLGAQRETLAHEFSVSFHSIVLNPKGSMTFQDCLMTYGCTFSPWRRLMRAKHGWLVATL